MIVTTGPLMIMGCSTNTASNGTVYYNVDVYDSNTGTLYNCSAKPDIYNQLVSTAKPASVKEMNLDIGKPWKGQCRLEVIGWK